MAGEAELLQGCLARLRQAELPDIADEIRTAWQREGLPTTVDVEELDPVRVAIWQLQVLLSVIESRVAIELESLVQLGALPGEPRVVLEGTSSEDLYLAQLRPELLRSLQSFRRFTSGVRAALEREYPDGLPDHEVGDADPR